MCGIAGIVNYQGRYSIDELRSLTLAMRDSIVHRGPDDAGIWISDDGMCALAHRRLSIIDLRPEGRQPMLNETGDVAVTFNGEIYNFARLTEKLKQDGHQFRSRTDTETLCHLFEGDADAAVRKLQGMFAFAAWRAPTRELILARDPYGKKPLYYADAGGVLAFASELRALEAIPDLCGAVDPVSVQQYLLLQYVHAPRTIYADCRKLPPGSMSRFTMNGDRFTETQTRYFRFEAREPTPAERAELKDENTAVDQLKEHLLQATRDRLMSDVPLGAFLSGGIDSSCVVAMMTKELGVRAKTFSIGFANTPQSEHLAARQIATILGAEHHEQILDSSAVDSFPEIAASLDEPNGDTSCLPVYLLSRFARQHVTVALSGDGGDEVFGGYDRYNATLIDARSPLRFLRGLRHYRGLWSPGQAYVGTRLLTFFEQQVKDLTGPLDYGIAAQLAGWKAFVNDRAQPIIHRLRTLDIDTYMPGAVLAKVDRMSMQFALEVRSPLLDMRLGQWASHLPAEWCNDGIHAKPLLKKLAARYLPPEIINRPKMGFGLPSCAWSQTRMLSWANDMLLSPNSRVLDFLDRRALQRHLDRQKSVERFSVYQIWALVVLEGWLGKLRPAARHSLHAAAT